MHNRPLHNAGVQLHAGSQACYPAVSKVSRHDLASCVPLLEMLRACIHVQFAVKWTTPVTATMSAAKATSAAMGHVCLVRAHNGHVTAPRVHYLPATMLCAYSSLHTTSHD